MTHFSGPRTTPTWYWCVHSPPCEVARENEIKYAHEHKSVFFFLMKLKVKWHGCVPIRPKFRVGG